MYLSSFFGTDSLIISRCVLFVAHRIAHLEVVSELPSCMPCVLRELFVTFQQVYHVGAVRSDLLTRGVVS